MQKEVIYLNKVEPIRDKQVINDIAEYLKNDNERNYVMFMMGIYSSLRVSDVLKLRVRDVRRLDYVRIKEKKTGKDKRFPINSELKKILKPYIEGKEDYELLVPNPNHPEKPITRQQAYNIINKAARYFGLDNIGTHTMRKTFGYHMYQMTHDAALIMDILNHCSIDYTLRYIGINQDTKDKAYNKLSFRV